MRIVERVRNFFARGVVSNTSLPAAIGTALGGGWHRIHEPFTGAWQRNMSKIVHRDVTNYSTVYACMSRISSDIGKLPFSVKRRDSNGLWTDDRHQTVSALLKRPNAYQTPAQFREAWVLSKLSTGNTYVLMQRERNVVTRLWVLDPARVQPMIAESGDVFYQLKYGTGNNLLPENYPGDELIVPASDIIHDREMALHHQLVGVGPLAAAYLAASKNIEIQSNAEACFRNAAQPGGILTAPAGMSDEDAQLVKDYWQKEQTGDNVGKVAVIGADMKFTPFAFKAADSQMVEQLRYTDEQISHAFGIPPFKVGIGSIPAGLKVDDLNQMYYADALQARIEARADRRPFRRGDDVGVELNLEPLLRMDAQKLGEVEGQLVKDGIKAPNEARRRFGLAPLTGGDSVYLQQQNYSMEALAKRDSSPDPFGTGDTSERSVDRRQMLTRDVPTNGGKRRARYNHDDGTWDVELDSGNWLRRIRQAA